MKRKLFGVVGLAAVLAIAGAACGDKAKTPATSSHTAASALSGAATLRVTLDSLLREHVYLAALATEDALQGQAKAFEAAAKSLDANSVDLSKAIGSVYGANAEAAFLPLWRSHINFVVTYTSNFGNEAVQDKAVTDLVNYAQTFGAFISGANPNLPKAAVAELVKGHILGLKDVIDAQQTKDYVKAGTLLRDAAEHMGMISSALSDAIVKQFPAKFP